MKTMFTLFLLLCALFSFSAGQGNKLNFIAYNLGMDSLGFGLNAVPDGQGGVTALTVGTDGNVYGATSATVKKTPYLIQFKRTSALVKGVAALDTKIKGQTRCNNALAAGGDGFIYGGSSVYEDSIFVRLKDWMDPRYEGGRLFRFKEGDSIAIEDLGVVLAKEGVRTLAVDGERQKIYGLTEPSYKFFIYDLKQKKLTVKPDTVFKEEEVLSRDIRLGELGKALVVAADGKVYGSASAGKLFCYSPDNDKIKITDIKIPCTPDHQRTVSVSAWTQAPDGTIYGGTYIDGVLFRFDPVTGKIWNLGKPAMTAFIRSLVVTADGTVCGVVGSKEDVPTVFKYRDGVYETVDFPMIPILRATYNCYANDLGPVVYLAKDGVLLFGGQGRIGKVIACYNN
ncbi:MAG: hypothetical protein V1913_18135 [Fibrobacterota bacterium]